MHSAAVATTIPSATTTARVSPWTMAKRQTQVSIRAHTNVHTYAYVCLRMHITVAAPFRLHCLYIVNFRFVINSLCTDLMWTTLRKHTCKNEKAKLELQVSKWECVCVQLYCCLLTISHWALLPLTLRVYFLLISARLLPAESMPAYTYLKFN